MNKAKIWNERLELENNIKSCQTCSLNTFPPNNIKCLGGGTCYETIYFFCSVAPSHKSLNLPYPNRINEARAFCTGIGETFRNLLMGVDLWENTYITNLLKCSTPGNRKPKLSEIKACRNFLKMELLLCKPKIIVAIGKEAQNEFFISQGEFREITYNGKKYIATGIHHPNYCFSYHKISTKEYRTELENIKEWLNNFQKK